MTMKTTTQTTALPKLDQMIERILTDDDGTLLTTWGRRTSALGVYRRGTRLYDEMARSSGKPRDAAYVLVIEWLAMGASEIQEDGVGIGWLGLDSMRDRRHIESRKIWVSEARARDYAHLLRADGAIRRALRQAGLLHAI